MITLVTLDSFTFSPIGASKAATSLARIVRRPLASPLLVVQPITSIAAAKRAIVKFLASFPTSLEKIVSFKYIVSKDLLSIKTIWVFPQRLFSFKYIPSKDTIPSKGSGITTTRLVSAYGKVLFKLSSSTLLSTFIGTSSKLKLVTNLSVARINTTSTVLSKLIAFKYLPDKQLFNLKASGMTTARISSSFAKFIVKNIVTSITSPLIGVSSKLKYMVTGGLNSLKLTTFNLQNIVTYKYLPSKDLSILKSTPMFVTKITSTYSKYIVRNLITSISSPLLSSSIKLKYTIDVSLLRFKAIPIKLQNIVTYKYLPSMDLTKIKATSIIATKISTTYVKYFLLNIKGSGMVLPRIMNVQSKPVIKAIVSTILTVTIAATSKIKTLEVSLPHLRTSAVKAGKISVANVMRWNANLAQQVITVVETTTQSIIEFWS